MSNINAFFPKTVKCPSTEQNESSFFLDNNTDNNQLKYKTENNKIEPKSLSQNQTGIKKKCKSCNKRLSLSNEFTCKCTGIYCGKHKYPDMHDCKFDHKENWTKQLKENNPQVIAEKVSKI